VKKISIRNIFNKSESKSGSGITKILIIILIVIVIAGVVYWWGYPLLFPINSVKATIATNSTENTPTTLEQSNSKLIKEEPVVKEKTEFEIEMEKREQGYKNKIFVYEPYQPPSNRDPFQKVRNIISEEIGQGEEGTEGQILRFPKPELPPGTKLSGIIDSKDKKVAIIEMNGETYIANLYDIISEKYIVKEINNDEVIIDFNGYFFSLKIGGEDTSNEL
jgi:type II secretory pathway component PulC